MTTTKDVYQLIQEYKEIPNFDDIPYKNIEPLKGWVVIWLFKDSLTKGGLYIPDNAEVQEISGVVVAIPEEDALGLNIGDHVVLPKFGHIQRTVCGPDGNIEVSFIQADKIICKLELA